MIGGLIKKLRHRLRLRNENESLVLQAHFARRGWAENGVDNGVDNFICLRSSRVTVPMRSNTRRSDRSQARFDSYTRGG